MRDPEAAPGGDHGAGFNPGRVLLFFWASVSLFPLTAMFLGSLLPGEFLLGKGETSLLGMLWSTFFPPGLLGFGSDAQTLTLGHYTDLVADGKLFFWVLNSGLVASAAALGQVLTAAGLAYVLAKHRFRGRMALLSGLGLLMMVPGQVLVVPLFVMVSRLGMVDSLWGVVAPALATPFGIFLMYTRISQLPDELLEAARIDGCSELALFGRIVLPLVSPAAATLAIFAFVGQWNSFLWPLLVLFGSERYTLPVGLATLQGQHQIEYGLLMAGATLAALPMVIVFLVFQRAFTRGMMSGAVKG